MSMREFVVLDKIGKLSITILKFRISDKHEMTDHKSVNNFQQTIKFELLVAPSSY